MDYDLRDAPWLPEDAVRFLESFLQPSHRVLELGGGSSTIWFSHHCSAIRTYENDTALIAVLREHVDHRCMAVFAGPEKLDEYPYLSQGYYDVVLIDGQVDRARSLLACVPLVKPGGIIMADNWDWYERDPSMVAVIQDRLALWNFSVARQRQPDKHGFRYAPGNPPYLWAAAWWHRPLETA